MKTNKITFVLILCALAVFSCQSPYLPVKPTSNSPTSSATSPGAGAPWTLVSLAGSGAAGTSNGTGAAASFRSPGGVAADVSGNVFVADTSNNLIRRISSSGVVTTLAGSGAVGSANGTGVAASFSAPAGVAADSSGNVYVADTGNNLIRKISSTGVVTTLAGSGAAGSSDGTGTAASLSSPGAVAVDASGNIYVADTGNSLIRKITSAGVVTTVTVSGTGGAFNKPEGIAVDSAGNLYVADTGNNLIREISSKGLVTTLAGSGTPGSSDGTGPAASFNKPEGISVDSSGNVYVADTGNNLIRMVTQAGVVTTRAGGGSTTLSGPGGVSVDASGNLYIADTGNDVIRKTATAALTAQQAVTNDAASLTPSSLTFGGTDTSSSVTENFAVPTSGPNGSTYTWSANPAVVLSFSGGTVTVNLPSTTTPVTLTVTITDGPVTTTKLLTVTVTASSSGTSAWVGQVTYGSANGTLTAASFRSPMGLATDGTNIYVADKMNNLIRQVVIATGVVTTLAGSGTSGSSDGSSTSASFNWPAGVATDGTNLYVADTGNNLIRQIVIATGAVTTLAGAGTEGFADGTGTGAQFYSPMGIAVVGLNLYVADGGNNLIRKVVIATGTVSTLAGTLPFLGHPCAGHADGTGTAASFDTPEGLATDGTNLFVADTSNNLIRQIVISSQVVSTLAGSFTNGGQGGKTNGTGSGASFYAPSCVATDGTNLYVGDSGNSLIRKIVIGTQAVTTLTAQGVPTWATFGLVLANATLFASNVNEINKIVLP